MTEKIVYSSAVADINEEMLIGFFDGWPNPPSPAMHLRILQGSYRAELAIDTSSEMVVGFINSISDGVLVAYIPLLEVLPDYRGRGIGRGLIKRMLASLGDLYAIDLLCDADIQAFYQNVGMSRATGMMVRNYERQTGKQEE